MTSCVVRFKKKGDKKVERKSALISCVCFFLLNFPVSNDQTPEKNELTVQEFS